MCPFHKYSKADKRCHQDDTPKEAPPEGVAVVPVAEEGLWVGSLYLVETLAWPGTLTVTWVIIRLGSLDTIVDASLSFLVFNSIQLYFAQHFSRNNYVLFSLVTRVRLNNVSSYYT